MKKTIINKGNTKSYRAWNKGLTKETDERIRLSSLKVSKSLKGKPGYPQDKESKNNLRKKDKQKIYLVQKQNNIKVLVLSKIHLSWKFIQAAIAQLGRADPL